jgi:hypothetical protein
MHHYGETDTYVAILADDFVFEFRNHETGAVITLRGPLKGVFEDSVKVMDEPKARAIADQLAHYLRALFV